MNKMHNNYLLSDRSRTSHILIRTICARANQANADVQRPAMLLRVFAELVNRMSQIRCEWTIDVRLELSQVDFDDLKIIDKY